MGRAANKLHLSLGLFARYEFLRQRLLGQDRVAEEGSKMYEGLTLPSAHFMSSPDPSIDAPR